MLFYAAPERNAAFNIHWHEQPVRRIDSFENGVSTCLTEPGMDNHAGDHSSEYPGFPDPRGPS